MVSLFPDFDWLQEYTFPFYFGKKYSITVQAKIVEVSLLKLEVAWSIFKTMPFQKFLKSFFHKFYLVYSWILCFI